jgi:tetratricopeptide (TPR) repeat protein
MPQRYTTWATFLGGRIDSASYRRAVAIKPDFADAYNKMGNLMRAKGIVDEAEALQRRALALKPDSAAVQIDLGSALRDKKEPKAAEDCFRKAISVDPASAVAHNNLGIALLDQGKVDAGMTAFRKAIDLEPKYAEAHNHLGIALQRLGRPEASTECYRRALAIKPDFVESLYNLSLNKKICSELAELNDIEKSLKPYKFSVRDQTYLHFALGNIYDSRHLYDKTFSHYEKTNDLKRPAFDRDAHVDFTSRLIGSFSKKLLRRLKRIGPPSTLPVFIVGMPRSGTTLVEKMISSHPHAHCAGELPDIERIVADLPKELGMPPPYTEKIGQIDARSAWSVGERYLAHLRMLSSGAKRITDKLPKNFMHLGVIALLFPKARIIHCKRHPLDTCLSCYFQNFIGPQPFAYDLRHLGVYYRDYERLMAHWRRVLPLRQLEVQYDNLVAYQEQVSRRIIAFCGLKWDNRCLEFFKHERSVRTASNVPIRQPMYTSSVGRWKHYESFLDPLKEELDWGRREDGVNGT